MFVFRLPKALLFGVLSCSLVSCIAQEKEPIVLPPGQIYDAAIAEYRARHYDASLERLAELERLYPFTGMAERAQVLSAYFQFEIRDFSGAVAVCDRYIVDHPAGGYLQYVHYIRVMALYRQIVDTSRSGFFIKEAFDAAGAFLIHYPKGKYSALMREILEELKDKMALKELKVGIFYLENGNYIAAIHRLSYIINDDSNSSNYMPEAIFRIYEAYSALNISKERIKYANMLLDKYPDSVWAKKIRQDGVL